jgi:hypothetical protein
VLVVVLKPALVSPRGYLSSGLGIAASWGGMGLGGISAAATNDPEVFGTFVKDLEACFTESLAEEQLTMGHLMRLLQRPPLTGINFLSTLAERHAQSSIITPASSSCPSSSPLPPVAPLDSLLDPYFVRDLQEAFLHEVHTRLEALKASNLSSAMTLEKQCARLMTLLRPFYSRCAIAPLTPPGKEPAFTKFMHEGREMLTPEMFGDKSSSSSTPVVVSTASSSDMSIQHATLETSKLLILRARRSFLREQREESLNSFDTSPTFKVDVTSKHGIEVQGVLRLIYSQLRDMCEAYGEEYSTTLKALMANRTAHIENFRWQLIHTLVARKIHTAEDKDIWRGFKDKFRVVTEADPFIVDFRATMSSMLTDTGVSSAAGRESTASILIISTCSALILPLLYYIY